MLLENTAHYFFAHLGIHTYDDMKGKTLCSYR